MLVCGLFNIYCMQNLCAIYGPLDETTRNINSLAQTELTCISESPQIRGLSWDITYSGNHQNMVELAINWQISVVIYFEVRIENKTIRCRFPFTN